MKKSSTIGLLASALALLSVDVSAVTTAGDRYTGLDCRAVSGTWTPTVGNNLRSSSSSSAAICPLRGVKSYDQIDVYVKANSTAPNCVVYTSSFNNFYDDSSEYWS
ncbi:MAG TPA: hypothetical protein VIM73_23180, partial [Polyangiaceae bacterium]